MGHLLPLSSLDGTTGFRLDGTIQQNDNNGRSVSCAGDVNGDGLDDFIVGNPGSGPGQSYVVFGKISSFGSSLALSALDGTTGFRLVGAGDDDYSGYSVAFAGDVNGDGFADVIVGSPFARDEI